MCFCLLSWESIAQTRNYYKISNASLYSDGLLTGAYLSKLTGQPVWIPWLISRRFSAHLTHLVEPNVFPFKTILYRFHPLSDSSNQCLMRITNYLPKQNYRVERLHMTLSSMLMLQPDPSNVISYLSWTFLTIWTPIKKVTGCSPANNTFSTKQQFSRKHNHPWQQRLPPLIYYPHGCKSLESFQMINTP